jgi:hypothetical protein
MDKSGLRSMVAMAGDLLLAVQVAPVKVAHSTPETPQAEALPTAKSPSTLRAVGLTAWLLSLALAVLPSLT